MTVIPNVVVALGTIPKSGKGIERHGNKMTCCDHQAYCKLKIGLNTEKGPADLRKFAVTQNPEKSSAKAGVKKSERIKIK